MVTGLRQPVISLLKLLKLYFGKSTQLSGPFLTSPFQLRLAIVNIPALHQPFNGGMVIGYESIATVGEIRVWWRADFQSGSRVLKKVF